MHLNQDLIKEISKKMGGVTKTRVRQKIKEIEEEQLLSKEAAACFLAHSLNLPLNNYFDHDVLKDVRETKQKGNIKPIKVYSTKKVEIKETLFKVDFDKIFRDIKEPLLPQSILNDAKEMATYYPLFYVFENSIRNFIIVVMRKNYGKDWWNNKIKTNKYFIKTCREVEGRKKAEDENRFHGKRVSHEIFYTDIDGLKKIINIFFPDFKPILNQEKFFYEHMFQTINLSRNIIAHNNPLNKRDFDRIKHAFSDWCDQLNRAKEKLGGIK